MKIALTRPCRGRRPTLAGWALILLVLGAAGYLVFSHLYDFLAPVAPPHRGIMAIEGWIHDEAVKTAAERFRKGDYAFIVCTGIPLERGSYLFPFHSYPELTARRLEVLGIPKEKIRVAVSPEVTRDRTWRAAQALARRLKELGVEGGDIELVTTGPHGRRSRYLFARALGPRFRVGVVSLPDETYAPEEWYTCSEGVRAVIGELLAYGYARLLFHPAGP